MVTRIVRSDWGSVFMAVGGYLLFLAAVVALCLALLLAFPARPVLADGPWPPPVPLPPGLFNYYAQDGRAVICAHPGCLVTAQNWLFNQGYTRQHVYTGYSATYGFPAWGIYAEQGMRVVGRSWSPGPLLVPTAVVGQVLYPPLPTWSCRYPGDRWCWD